MLYKNTAHYRMYSVRHLWYEFEQKHLLESECNRECITYTHCLTALLTGSPLRHR